MPKLQIPEEEPGMGLVKLPGRQVGRGSASEQVIKPLKVNNFPNAI